MLFALLFVAFFAISVAVRLGDTSALDLRFTRTLQTHMPLIGDRIALGLKFLGNGGTLFAVATVAAIALYRAHHRVEALFALLTPLGELIDFAMKTAFGRPRPSRDLVHVLAPTFGLSYPSGHAMASTMVYGFLGYLAWTRLEGPRRFWLTALCAFLAVAIGVSRIYVGAHWLSDVLGGWCSGCFFLMIFIHLHRKYTANRPAASAQ
jgi:membrane-associated phospholipid phosphatase